MHRISALVHVPFSARWSWRLLLLWRRYLFLAVVYSCWRSLRVCPRYCPSYHALQSFVPMAMSKLSGFGIFFFGRCYSSRLGDKMAIAKDRCLSRARHERSRNRQCNGSLVLYGGRRHGGTSGVQVRDQGRRQTRSNMSILLLACLG